MGRERSELESEARINGSADIGEERNANAARQARGGVWRDTLLALDEERSNIEEARVLRARYNERMETTKCARDAAKAAAERKQEEERQAREAADAARVEQDAERLERTEAECRSRTDEAERRTSEALAATGRAVHETEESTDRRLREAKLASDALLEASRGEVRREGERANSAEMALALAEERAERAVKEAGETREDADTRVGGAEESRKRAEQAMREQEEELDVERGKRAEATAGAQEVKDELVAARQEVEELTRVRGALETEMQRFRDTMASEAEAHREEQVAFTQRLQVSEEATERQQLELQSGNEGRVQLEEELAHSRNEAAELLALTKELAEVNAKAAQDVKDAREEAAEIEESGRDNEDAAVRRALEAEAEVKRASEMLAGFRMQLREAKAEVAQSRTGAGALTHIRAELALAEKERDVLAEAMAVARADAEHTKHTVETETKGISSDLEHARSEAERHRRDAVEALRENRKLRRELEDVVKRRAEEMSTLNEELEVERERVSHVEAELSHDKEARRRIDREGARALRESTSLKSQLAVLRAGGELPEEAEDELIKELRRKDEEKSRVSAERDQLRERLEEAGDEVREANRKVQVVVAQLGKARGQLTQSQTALKSALEENRNMLQDASQAETERASLTAASNRRLRESETARRELETSLRRGQLDVMRAKVGAGSPAPNSSMSPRSAAGEEKEPTYAAGGRHEEEYSAGGGYERTRGGKAGKSRRHARHSTSNDDDDLEEDGSDSHSGGGVSGGGGRGGKADRRRRRDGSKRSSGGSSVLDRVMNRLAPKGSAVSREAADEIMKILERPKASYCC